MKKSILILPSIVLLFLVNACTPLPTGGPVSSNVIYKVYNKSYNVSYLDNARNDMDSFYVDINNDSYEDIMINSTGWWVLLKVINGIEFATVVDTINHVDKIKSFALNGPVNTVETFNNTAFVPMFGDVRFPSFSSDILNYRDENYIGYRYFDGSDYYYGWIRIYIKSSFLSYDVKIIESAYNTIPNQPILAGKK